MCDQWKKEKEIQGFKYGEIHQIIKTFWSLRDKMVYMEMDLVSRRPKFSLGEVCHI